MNLWYKYSFLIEEIKISLQRENKTASVIGWF